MHPPMLKRLEGYFEFAHLGTNWRTEILAGVTTFLTMAYIVLVNPAILSAAGVPLAAATAATCLSAAFGSLTMGIVARYPIALAPGMGLNAYFTYTVVKGMGIPWETALGAVFLSGIAFIVLIGLHTSGIIVASKETMVSMGNLRDSNTLLAIFGLLLIASLRAWNLSGAILIGILATTAVGAIVGLVRWQPQTYSFADITATAF